VKSLLDLRLKARLVVLFLIAGIVPVTLVVLLSLYKASALVTISSVVVLMIGIAILAVFTGRQIASRICRAVEVAKSIAVGDLSKSLNIHSNDEFGELSDAYDSMTTALRNKAEVAQAIAEGDVEADIEIGGQDDVLGHAMVTMRNSINAMVRDVEKLVMAAKREDFSVRSDADKHSGEYHNIINGINETLEAVTGKIFWFEQMLDAMPLMVSVTDNDLNWTFFNKAVEEVIGKKRSELIGKQCSNWGTEICNTDGCAIAQFKKNNPTVEFKYSGLDIKADSNKILNSAGEQIGFLEVIQNVTPQRRVSHYMENMVVDISDKLSLMANGDLSFQMKIAEADEYTEETKKSFDDIGVALNGSLNSLNEVLGQIRMASQQVNSGAQQVSGASQSLSQGATEQASSLEEISASMTQVGGQVKMNADNAIQASKLTEAARNDAHSGNEHMHEMLEAMNVINDQSSEVQKIIKVIDEIAFQTNLLALNAAVEAARAGVHGKGFAVVAEEVRNLAQRSAKAAKETTDLIEGNVNSVHRGVEIAESTAGALANIVNGITKATDLVNEISSASQEQRSAIDQITDALGQIDHVTQANTANAEESAAAAEELSGQSSQMQNMIGKFRLANGHSGTRHANRQYKIGSDNGTDYGNGNGNSGAVDPQPSDIVFNGSSANTKVTNPNEVIHLDDEDFAGF